MGGLKSVFKFLTTFIKDQDACLLPVSIPSLYAMTSRDPAQKPLACAEERPCIIWGNGSSWGSRKVLLIVPNVIVYDYISFGGFPGGSVGKESACNPGGLGSIPGLGRPPGEGKGYPLQYSGLEPWDCKESDTTEQLSLHFTSYIILRFMRRVIWSPHHEVSRTRIIRI